MNTLYPIATLGSQILIVNEGDISFIGGERALEVMCIQVDFRHAKIYPIIALEKHFKFNPWEELSDTGRREALQKLHTTFSDEDIAKNITGPLSASLIQHK